jgi:hypothetical protein
MFNVRSVLTEILSGLDATGSSYQYEHINSQQLMRPPLPPPPIPPSIPTMSQEAKGLQSTSVHPTQTRTFSSNRPLNTKSSYQSSSLTSSHITNQTTSSSLSPSVSTSSTTSNFQSTNCPTKLPTTRNNPLGKQASPLSSSVPNYNRNTSSPMVSINQTLFSTTKLSHSSLSKLKQK